MTRFRTFAIMGWSGDGDTGPGGPALRACITHPITKKRLPPPAFALNVVRLYEELRMAGQPPAWAGAFRETPHWRWSCNKVHTRQRVETFIAPAGGQAGAARRKRRAEHLGGDTALYRDFTIAIIGFILAEVGL